MARELVRYHAWLFLTAAHGWLVYGNKPVSESEIKREMERQSGPH